jgi:hypothetical protein
MPRRDDFGRRADATRAVWPFERDGDVRLMEPTELLARQARGERRAAAELRTRRGELLRLIECLQDEIDPWWDVDDDRHGEVPTVGEIARMTVREIEEYDVINSEPFSPQSLGGVARTNRQCDEYFNAYARRRINTDRQALDLTLFQVMGLAAFDEDVDSDESSDDEHRAHAPLEPRRLARATSGPEPRRPWGPSDTTTTTTMESYEPSQPAGWVRGAGMSSGGGPSSAPTTMEPYEPPSPSHSPYRRVSRVEAERVANDAKARSDASVRPRYAHCVVCWDREPLYAPRCGHVCMCGACANETIRRGEPCPVCRGPVTSDELRRTYAFGRSHWW